MEERTFTPNKGGRIFGGLIIIGVGVLYLLRQMGTVFPPWLFTWQSLLLVAGLYVGVRHRFRHGGWIIMMGVGALFMAELLFPTMNIGQFIWPALIIGCGLFMIFTPNRWKRRMERKERWKRKWEEKFGDESWSRFEGRTNPSGEDRIESTAVFGGIKKVIVSKDFKGGEINLVFGGAEINLSQADIQGTIHLEINQVFGGTRLIIPPHWEVQSNVVSVLASFEDKRPATGTPDPNKVLVLDGSCVMGGIDILSY